MKVIYAANTITTSVLFPLELIADPTKCKIMGDIDGIKLEDIAHSTNGITELSVFGHRDQNYRDSIRFAIDNFFYKSVHIRKQGTFTNKTTVDIN